LSIKSIVKDNKQHTDKPINEYFFFLFFSFGLIGLFPVGAGAYKRKSTKHNAKTKNTIEPSKKKLS